MSVATAALRFSCDVTRCGVQTFVVPDDIPAAWRRLTVAGGQPSAGSEGPGIDIDLCPDHAEHLGAHSPLMPGGVKVELVGTVLILSHDLACTGCAWSFDQVIPATAIAARRNALLATAWLAHLDPAAQPVEPVVPNASEAVCLMT
ncbi:MAG: hypothetical protein HOV87_31280 [Catenulispora sp.]|nr:hypothetical protein [Catenulispora sp.]